ncbi:MAG: hypothetical protein GXX85_17170 [Ignavibacteria bacterium]|mgnify:CR=1 FL=1|nr:hypothetical protein [Ignavibacteria bacterium]
MRKILSLIALLSVATLLQGQQRSFDKFSYGIQIVNFHNEFGIGAHILSPEFKNLRVNFRSNLNWLNHPDEQNNQTWSEFLTAQIGINYQRSITNRISLYSEGGIVSVFPNPDFSDESTSIGGYGLFGFEFFLTENTKRNPSYFIELGGIGTSVTANKIISNPIYANGFLISVGFRF